MSGRSSYDPKSRFAKWLDVRLPLPRLIHDQFIVFATPRNLNIWYTFGGILTFCLGVQILSGIVLAMHYVPNAGLAFDAIERIVRDVNYGWLIRTIHATGASMFPSPSIFTCCAAYTTGPTRLRASCCGASAS